MTIDGEVIEAFLVDRDSSTFARLEHCPTYLDRRQP